MLGVLPCPALALAQGAGPPARLDPSTPRRQSGYTLLAVQRTDWGGECKLKLGPGREYDGFIVGNGADGTAFWIRAPFAPIQGSGTKASVLRDAITITARLSTGDHIGVPWRPELEFHLSDRKPPRVTGEPNLLFAYLWPGYPNAVRYADILLHDRRGATVRWRITHLPRMRHMLVHPRIRSTVRVPGITVRGWAYREDWPGSDSDRHSIRYSLKATGAPNRPYGRDLRITGVWNEWESVAYKPEPSSAKENPIDPKSGAEVEAHRFAPYWMYDRYARLQGAVVPFDNYDEQVTFHDIEVVRHEDSVFFRVARAQFAKTPSGITITLPVQNMDPNHPTVTSGMNLLVKVAPGWMSLRLPSSPLYRKHRRAIDLSVVRAGGYRRTGWAGGLLIGPEDTKQFSFDLPQHPPARIPTLTLVVRETAYLKPYPIDLVVPVLKQPSH